MPIKNTNTKPQEHQFLLIKFKQKKKTSYGKTKLISEQNLFCQLFILFVNFSKFPHSHSPVYENVGIFQILL